MSEIAIDVGTRTDADIGWARCLALAVPALLLAGALGSQYIGGLYPCEMCHWQRWGHYAALGFAFKTRLHRRAGLALFALALLRVAIVDVAELGLFYRMLAFLTLGVCLLAVSFLYAKYADDLQRWL